MKTKQLILRWSLVTGGLIALFWWNYYVFFGDVPIVTSIKMTQNWIITLPFGISRWWDILIGPIWSTIIILFLLSKKLKKLKEGKHLVTGLSNALDFSLVFSLTAGLVAGLAVGLGVGLDVGLGIALGVGLLSGLVVSLTAGLVAGLVVGLGAGLVVGLGIALGAGLPSGLVVNLTAGLVACLAALIKWVASANFWTKVWNWMLVK